MGAQRHRQVSAWESSWAHPAIFAGNGTRGAADGWYGTAAAVEASAATAEPVANVSLDLWK